MQREWEIIVLGVREEWENKWIGEKQGGHIIEVYVAIEWEWVFGGDSKWEIKWLWKNIREFD